MMNNNLEEFINNGVSSLEEFLNDMNNLDKKYKYYLYDYFTIHNPTVFNDIAEYILKRIAEDGGDYAGNMEAFFKIIARLNNKVLKIKILEVVIKLLLKNELDKEIINKMKDVLSKFDIDIKNLDLNEFINKFNKFIIRDDSITKARKNIENSINKNKYEDIKVVSKDLRGIKRLRKQIKNGDAILADNAKLFLKKYAIKNRQGSKIIGGLFNTIKKTASRLINKTKYVSVSGLGISSAMGAKLGNGLGAGKQLSSAEKANSKLGESLGNINKKLNNNNNNKDISNNQNNSQNNSQNKNQNTKFNEEKLTNQADKQKQNINTNEQTNNNTSKPDNNLMDNVSKIEDLLNNQKSNNNIENKTTKTITENKPIEDLSIITTNKTNTKINDDKIPENTEKMDDKNKETSNNPNTTDSLKPDEVGNTNPIVDFLAFGDDFKTNQQLVKTCENNENNELDIIKNFTDFTDDYKYLSPQEQTNNKQSNPSPKPKDAEQTNQNPHIKAEEERKLKRENQENNKSFP